MCDPSDLVCEAALERALRRNGLTLARLADKLNMSPGGLSAALAMGRPVRQRIETALQLAPGALLFRP